MAWLKLAALQKVVVPMRSVIETTELVAKPPRSAANLAAGLARQRLRLGRCHHHLDRAAVRNSLGGCIDVGGREHCDIQRERLAS